MFATPLVSFLLDATEREEHERNPANNNSFEEEDEKITKDEEEEQTLTICELDQAADPLALLS